MRNVNFLEIIGFILFIMGFIFQCIHLKLVESIISVISEQHQLFYWAGLSIWALGSMKKQIDKERKKKGRFINY